MYTPSVTSEGRTGWLVTENSARPDRFPVADGCGRQTAASTLCAGPGTTTDPIGATGPGGLTLITSGPVSVLPSESATCTVKPVVPVADGVPLTVPSVNISSPGGRLPEKRVKVKGGVPPAFHLQDRKSTRLNS